MAILFSGSAHRQNFHLRNEVDRTSAFHYSARHWQSVDVPQQSHSRAVRWAPIYAPFHRHPNRYQSLQIGHLVQKHRQRASVHLALTLTQLPA